MTFSLQIVDVQVYLNPFLQYRHSDFIAGRGVNRFVVIIISFTAYLLSTEWRGPGIDPLPSRRCLTPALQTCGADMKGVMHYFLFQEASAPARARRWTPPPRNTAGDFFGGGLQEAALLRVAVRPGRARRATSFFPLQIQNKTAARGQGNNSRPDPALFF